MPGRTLRDLARRRLSVLSGVGPKLEERLGALGLESVLDLIEHYPRRYLDRTKRAEIADMRFGEEATVVGEVRQMASRRTKGGRSLVEGVIFDGTSYLYVAFFNQAWRATQLPTGTEAAFFGRLERYRGRPRMTNPVVDVVGEMGERTGV
ncbi:MAG: ATP-dependent DNA helicase RecG, partial [Acidimicrobiia bacterium]